MGDLGVWGLGISGFRGLGARAFRGLGDAVLGFRNLGIRFLVFVIRVHGLGLGVCVG